LTICQTTTADNRLTDIRRAAFVYLAFSLDKLRDYNSRQTRWITQRGATANTFDSHNFAMRWTYTEMAIMTEGVGVDWAFKQTAKCIKELTELIAFSSSVDGPLFKDPRNDEMAPPVIITCKSGDALDHISDASIDAVVMDPPYGANVMYAELSDFFYVWLKRTAGLVMPELFTRYLTDKNS
jgi:putative DNA methylase